MTSHLEFQIVAEHSYPDLTPYVLGFALCLLGFIWTLLELIRRVRR